MGGEADSPEKNNNILGEGTYGKVIKAIQRGTQR